MSDNEGFVAIYRSLNNHWISKNLTYMGLWIDMILRAEWRKDARLKRGELEWDYSDFVGRGVTKRQVKYLVNRLVEMGEVECLRCVRGGAGVRPQRGRLFINHYEDYQVKKNGEGPRSVRGLSEVRQNTPTLPNDDKPIEASNNQQVTTNNEESRLNYIAPEVPASVKPKSDHIQFTDHIIRTYALRYNGMKPANRWGEFNKVLKGKLKEHGLDTMKRAWDYWLADYGNWPVKVAHQPVAFARSLDPYLFRALNNGMTAEELAEQAHWKQLWEETAAQREDANQTPDTASTGAENTEVA